MAIREGKWDCDYCDAANPGSEMKCTSCGATRGENVKFYLEEDAQEVTDGEKLSLAQGGADWHCAYCGTDNRAGSEKCRQCAAPREGMESREEKFVPKDGSTQEDEEAGNAPPPPAPSGKGKPILFGAIGVVLIAAVLFFIFGRGKEASVVLESGEWTREIAIEEQSWVTYEKWDDQVPSDAQILNRWEAKRGTEKVQVGTESVKTGTKDKGNGYFEDVYEERPVYEERDVYDTMVKYEVQEWKEVREAATSGGINDPPIWPNVSLLSNEREGNRTEEASLTFKSTDPEKEGETYTYSKLDAVELSSYKVGQAYDVVVVGKRVTKFIEEE